MAERATMLTELQRLKENPKLKSEMLKGISFVEMCSGHFYAAEDTVGDIINAGMAVFPTGEFLPYLGSPATSADVIYGIVGWDARGNVVQDVVNHESAATSTACNKKLQFIPYLNGIHLIEGTGGNQTVVMNDESAGDDLVAILDGIYDAAQELAWSIPPDGILVLNQLIVEETAGSAGTLTLNVTSPVDISTFIAMQASAELTSTEETMWDADWQPLIIHGGPYGRYVKFTSAGVSSEWTVKVDADLYARWSGPNWYEQLKALYYVYSRDLPQVAATSDLANGGIEVL